MARSSRIFRRPSRPTLSHSIQEPKFAVAHDVQVAAGSRLEQALGASVTTAHTCRVNSRHHQSVDRIGSGLAASAVAADGVVEAIERAEGTFCLGVQWHPENFWRTGEFAPLFEAFVRAAGERLDSKE